VDRTDAINALCDFLLPGATVYVIVRTTSKARMSCTMDLYTVTGTRLQRITHHVALALDLKENAQGAVTMRGWGRDAPDAVVMNLSYALHGTSGAGRGLIPNGLCEVPDAANYRAGYSLKTEIL
jgi:hypothetical protein